jgi:hypothetical protein
MFLSQSGNCLGEKVTSNDNPQEMTEWNSHVSGLVEVLIVITTKLQRRWGIELFLEKMERKEI